MRDWDIRDYGFINSRFCWKTSNFERAIKEETSFVAAISLIARECGAIGIAR